MALSEIEDIEEKVNGLDENKVAKFAYTEQAFGNDIVDGVPSFSTAQQMNVPDKDHTDMLPRVLETGIQTAGASLPRNAINHFFGRVSYNLNKIIQKLSSFFAIYKEDYRANCRPYDATVKYVEGDFVRFNNRLYVRNSTSSGTIAGKSPLESDYWTGFASFMADYAIHANHASSADNATNATNANHSSSADNATNDSNGNNIEDTYLTLSKLSQAEGVFEWGKNIPSSVSSTSFIDIELSDLATKPYLTIIFRRWQSSSWEYYTETFYLYIATQHSTKSYFYGKSVYGLAKLTRLVLQAQADSLTCRVNYYMVDPDTTYTLVRAYIHA